MHVAPEHRLAFSGDTRMEFESDVAGDGGEGKVKTWLPTKKWPRRGLVHGGEIASGMGTLESCVSEFRKRESGQGRDRTDDGRIGGTDDGLELVPDDAPNGEEGAVADICAEDTDTDAAGGSRTAEPTDGAVAGLGTETFLGTSVLHG
jgi:hypothetical protein